jgi:signal transduction histidine kinase
MAGDLAESREQLRDAERQAAWGEMARQIAHEIKNPLTPMRMSAQMLLRARREKDPRADDLAERLARNILQQTDELDRIATDFRQFAGSPRRDVEAVCADDLLGSVQELVAGMAEGAGPRITFVPGAKDAMVAVDLQEMRRVFLNLIHNAVQACGDAGRIEVGSRSVNGGVEYYVEDDGPGIPDDVRQRLFEPYFTTKTSGTGLGLAICRKIVEAHRGEMKLADSAPRRTVFVLTLPGIPSEGSLE